MIILSRNYSSTAACAYCSPPAVCRLLPAVCRPPPQSATRCLPPALCRPLPQPADRRLSFATLRPLLSARYSPPATAARYSPSAGTARHHSSPPANSRRAGRLLSGKPAFVRICAESAAYVCRKEINVILFGFRRCRNGIFVYICTNKQR